MTFMPAILLTSSSMQGFAAFCAIFATAAFRVIDTHAASGLYDLGGEKALRGGEWQDGIGKLMAAKIPEATAALLWPYLEVVRALNDRNRLARAWLRAQDRLIACEPEPKASSSLTRNLEGDARIKNGWTGYECLRATKGAARPGAGRSFI